mmetsp:Transcript_24050/g.83466  ORF Transcript_24050/g.83466 Transcript_24050/m.83466 type:complete len:207 (-) Transcript_24050:4904-5524(-)
MPSHTSLHTAAASASTSREPRNAAGTTVAALRLTRSGARRTSCSMAWPAAARPAPLSAVACMASSRSTYLRTLPALATLAIAAAADASSLCMPADAPSTHAPSVLSSADDSALRSGASRACPASATTMRAAPPRVGTPTPDLIRTRRRSHRSGSWLPVTALTHRVTMSPSVPLPAAATRRFSSSAPLMSPSAPSCMPVPASACSCR